MSRRDNINFLNFFIKFLFYIWKFHLESFVISNVKIFNGFDNHFGQIKCLENEKNEKPKKTSGQDNIILFDFCQAQPKPSLAGLSLAIYPISTSHPPGKVFLDKLERWNLAQTLTRLNWLR